MKKVVEKNDENRKEFDLKEVFVLWKSKAKSGLEYLSGITAEELGFGVKAFYNTNKRNPKEPDIRVYQLDDKGNLTKTEVAALWENISKNEKRYLTGLDNEKRKLIAFYSDLSKNENAPYIRAYYEKESN